MAYFSEYSMYRLLFCLELGPFFEVLKAQNIQQSMILADWEPYTGLIVGVPCIFHKYISGGNQGWLERKLWEPSG